MSRQRTSVRTNIAEAARSVTAVKQVATDAGAALAIVAVSLAVIAVSLVIGVAIYAARTV